MQRCQPAVRHVQGAGGVVVLAGPGRALVKRHDNVGPNHPLNVHHALGRKQMLAAVHVRAELHALFLNLPGVAERVHLVAARVGENGPVPAVELVQAAGRLQHLQPRPQVEVVGIAEDNLGLHIVLQRDLAHGLHGAGGAHRHENGRFDGAVGRLEQAGAGLGGGVLGEEVEGHAGWNGHPERSAAN